MVGGFRKDFWLLEVHHQIGSEWAGTFNMNFVQCNQYTPIFRTAR